MMNRAEVVSLLRCPITGNSLTWLDETEVVKVNQLSKSGKLFYGDGRKVNVIHESFLKVKDELIYYPVQKNILCLLPDFAIVAEFDHAKLDRQLLNESIKQDIQAFYDQVGWQGDTQHFQDAKDSEDLRTISQEYIDQCHHRINRFLPKTGKYLLDVASGPIQYPVYLTYSENYDYRICADLSLTGLLRAQEKLGDKGIYLLCDVTQLPIQNNQIDAIISLHTLYHVPQAEQSKAFDELYRVLKPGGKSVVVYSWGKHAFLMKLFLFPFKLVKRTLEKMRNKKAVLYFYAHPFSWFKKTLVPQYSTQLYVWRSVNVPFLKIYIHRWLLGRQLLKLIYRLEEKYPKLMGRMGAYPMFVTQKKKSDGFKTV